MSLSREQVEKVARLAELHVRPEELPALAEQRNVTSPKSSVLPSARTI